MTANYECQSFLAVRSYDVAEADSISAIYADHERRMPFALAERTEDEVLSRIVNVDVDVERITCLRLPRDRAHAAARQTLTARHEVAVFAVGRNRHDNSVARR